MTNEQIRATSRWARVNLGLSEKEFYALTPAEWEDYASLWYSRERRLDIRAARLQVTLASCTAPKSSGAYTLEDFLPPDMLKAKTEKPKRKPRIDLRKAFFAATSKHQHIFLNGKQ